MCRKALYPTCVGEAFLNLRPFFILRQPKHCCVGLPAGTFCVKEHSRHTLWDRVGTFRIMVPGWILGVGSILCRGSFLARASRNCRDNLRELLGGLCVRESWAKRKLTSITPRVGSKHVNKPATHQPMPRSFDAKPTTVWAKVKLVGTVGSKLSAKSRQAASCTVVKLVPRQTEQATPKPMLLMGS